MTQDSPIGIFDSGVGGTSIWKEVHKLLPFEHTIYLADSLHAPYGDKPSAEIVRLSMKNSQKLIDMGCKIIVVACNTATTNAINVLRATYSLPFIGIEPAIKPAAINTSTKAIGILATRGTFSSALFNRTSDSFASDVEVIEIVGSGLVPLIEKGALYAPETQMLLEKYMAPMIKANIDYLVLGCSHYPYLIPSYGSCSQIRLP
jgi:glutamate racemase